MTNEHISLEKYTSHTLFSKELRKGWFRICVRSELETEQTTTYWPQVPLTIAALLPHSAGLLGAGLLYGILSPNMTGTRTPTNSNRLWHLVIWLFGVHLLPVGAAIAPSSTRPQVKAITRYLRPDALVWRLYLGLVCYNSGVVLMQLSFVCTWCSHCYSYSS